MRKKIMKAKILIISFFIITSCATKPPGIVPKAPEAAPEIGFTGEKLRPTETILLDHKYFKIAYNPIRRLARYVVYSLSDTQLKNKVGNRKNKFIPDPILINKVIPYVLPTEYAGTGYDRGHLAPSGDFLWNQKVNDLTFIMSNMAPQTPNLNRDSWRRLEDQVRKWACGEKKITVITGPILKAGLKRIKSGLEIPEDFFKVVIDETPPKKIISFIYHQKDRGDVLTKRIVPIEKVEKESGIIFKKEFSEMKGEITSPSAVGEWKEGDCG